MRKYFICRSNTASQVVWKKDKLTLKKGIGQSFRKSDTEIRVMVDTFSTLYLIGNIILYIIAILKIKKKKIKRIKLQS